MTSEVEWRRKWKPDLRASPWQSVSIHDEIYLVKYCFNQDSYELLITDLTRFWHESLSDKAIKKRVAKLNPGIEAPLTRILDQIKSVLEKTQEESKPSLKLSFKDGDGEEERVMVSMTSKLAGMPFAWNFQCKAAEKAMATDHLTLPLMAMVGELTRRQQELVKIIQGKDKEIDDYKSQGAKTTRKHIQTPAFVETAFEMNMMTSKDFERTVGRSHGQVFDPNVQDLYRQVMTKTAWMNRRRSDGQSGDDESLLDDLPQDGGARKSSTGQSWGNSRLPPSLQQSKSPNKSPTKSPAKSPPKAPSPSKSSTHTSPNASPVKDTELLRRQALERRLELEEQKKMEKTKKKKKMGF